MDRKLNYGNLFRSNWNGTYYSLMLDNVNEDFTGHVDFEKIAGLNGVVIANQLQNPGDSSLNRQITTKISYDDGNSFFQHAIKVLIS
jgi:hypothetical protein